MSRSHRSIVLIGLTALAVAMGIGRFAFTPLMPLMLRDATLDAATGAEWAAANYVGYLLGALSASRFSHQPHRGLQWGLAGVAGSTLGMLLSTPSLPWLGALLRGMAGICSAWVLVCASSWCLPALARRQASAWGGWMYTGVGVGIALTGVLAWLGGHQSAWALWLELGVLACVGTWAVWRMLSAPSFSPDMQSRVAAPDPNRALPAHRQPVGLIVCYGAFGYGYIVPATFLPTMGRQLVDDPWVFGLTWPLFGLAAALSVAMASRWLSGWPRQRVWALAQAVMALGTLIPLLQFSLWALACSAVLVGGTFMVATMAGLQLAREQRPENPTPLLARMTVAFALGQIAGPLLVRGMGVIDIPAAEALNLANGLATLILIVTAIGLWRGETHHRPT